MSSVVAKFTIVRNDFGVFGAVSAIHMQEALQAHSLDLSYDRNTKAFTVTGSNNLNAASLKAILATKNYFYWMPNVLPNLKVELLETLPTTNAPTWLYQKIISSIDLSAEELSRIQELFLMQMELLAA